MLSKHTKTQSHGRGKGRFTLALLPLLLLARLPAQDCVPPLALRPGGESFAVAATPWVLESADFDGDGRPDLVAVSRAGGTSTLTVYLVADGRDIVLASELTLEDSTYAVVARDLDRDGDVDVATASSNAVFVLLNSGDGTLGEPVPYAMPSTTRHVVLADLDGDNAPELVAAHRSETTLSVLANAGDGTFGPPVPLVVGDRPQAVAAADLDRDGLVDLVTANAGSKDLTILPRQDDGTFAEAVSHPLGELTPTGLLVGDLSGEGHPDVVVTTTSTAVVLINRAGAGFADPVELVAVGLQDVRLTDIDGDDDVDVAIAQRPDLMVVHLNDGGGGFTETLDLRGLPFLSTSIASGDFDGDGATDLASTSLNTSTIGFLWGGEVDPIVLRSVKLPIVDGCSGQSDCRPHAGAIADFDDEGFLDVVGVLPTPPKLVLARNVGGRLEVESALPYGGSGARAAATADIDLDGKADLLTVGTNGSAALLLGRGDGTFRSGGGTSAPDRVFSARFGDVNGDGAADLVVGSDNGDVRVRLNESTPGRPRFGGNVSRTFSGEAHVEIVDLDQDGLADVAVAHGGATNVSILKGVGEGDLQRVASLSVPLVDRPGDIVSGDLNADGMPDIVTANTSGASVSVLLGAGNGTLAEPRDFAVTRSPHTALIVDMNGDAFGDIVTASESGAAVSILRGHGDGTFEPSRTFPAGQGLRGILAGDLDLDGDIDLVSYDRVGKSFTVIYNESLQGNAPVAPGCGPDTEPEPDAAELLAPALSLEIPADTTVCGLFREAGRDRTLRDEYHLKSVLTLRPGIIDLANDKEHFEAGIVDELHFGPDAEPATPQEPGRFSLLTFPAPSGGTVFRYTYEQRFTLADGRTLTLKLAKPFNFRVMSEGESHHQILDEEYFTTLSGNEPLRGAIEGESFILYGSCTHELLDTFQVDFALEDGTTVTLTERYREADSLFDTGPASVQHASVTIAGATREVTSYYDLVYSASRHNTRRNYWVILDPPQNVAGVDEPVHAITLGAPEPDLGRPQSVADYFGASLRSIDSPRVVSYERSAAGPSRFLRGDVDGDAQTTITDAIALLDFLFRGGEVPACPKAADTDDNGRLNLTDAVRIPAHFFGGGPAIRAPFPECGEDPTPDGLTCEGFACPQS